MGQQSGASDRRDSTSSAVGEGADALLADMLQTLSDDLRQPAPSPAAYRELVAELAAAAGTSDDEGFVTQLDHRLAAMAEHGDAERTALADVVATLARRLAPDGRPSRGGAGDTLWQALVASAARLHQCGFATMGRLSFVTDRLLESMRLEARAQLAQAPSSPKRRVAEAGQLLSHLAVSRKLQQAIGEALGGPIRPSLRATYLYDPPGSHVQTHLDAREFEITYHLVLDHTIPTGSPGSALLAHLPGQSDPVRAALVPGDSVALRGRGTLHSWEPLAADEHRTLVAVAWADA
jgi:hypothetical protein